MDELPEPIVKAGRWRISIIWLIPALAALIGAWMAFKAYTGRGPTVTISFQSGEGIEAGQTRIRVRAVEIGRVSAVTLSHDLSQVLVTAELKKEAMGLLSENSQFWVVRARIGTAGISGLGTLISGAYIGFEPGQPGPATALPPRTFKGLETAPILTSHEPGQLVKLRATQLGSLNIGSPVHFRQIQAGEVVAFDLDKDGQSVSITLFIHAPYDSLLRLGTRFWDAGGVEAVADANGVRLRSESLVDLMVGGISFENPVSLEMNSPVPSGHIFTLFPDHDKIRDSVFLERHYYVANFAGSMRGLSRGAPVEYRGIKVGQVEDFTLEFHPGNPQGAIPVLLALEPDRFQPLGAKPESADAVMRKLVERGLRAELKTGSMLTGSLFVDLTFQPKAPRRTLTRYGAYLEIPTTPSTAGALMDNLTRFTERLQKLPLEDVAEQVRTSLPILKEDLKQARALLERLDGETLPAAQATLQQAKATLAALERTLNADSPVQQDLHGALDEFAKAARAMKDLADTLERHPESVIFGKGKKP